MRATSPTGLYVGSYGFVLDLDRSGTRPSHGFIHAPSLPHAASAAVLRSGWISRGNNDNESPAAIDLASGRVRQADWILSGVRHGQDLGDLLGAEFERSFTMPGSMSRSGHCAPRSPLPMASATLPSTCPSTVFDCSICTGPASSMPPSTASPSQTDEKDRPRRPPRRPGIDVRRSRRRHDVRDGPPPRRRQPRPGRRRRRRDGSERRAAARADRCAHPSGCPHRRHPCPGADRRVRFQPGQRLGRRHARPLRPGARRLGRRRPATARRRRLAGHDGQGRHRRTAARRAGGLGARRMRARQRRPGLDHAGASSPCRAGQPAALTRRPSPERRRHRGDHPRRVPAAGRRAQTRDPGVDARRRLVRRRAR